MVDHFTDTVSGDSEVNNCFSIYHTSRITSEPNINFNCLRVTLFEMGSNFAWFFFGCSEVNRTWPPSESSN